jgi:IS30 family transposase
MPLSGPWPTTPGSGPENIHDIVLTYKTTPRKCLDFRTPAEAFLLLKTNIVTLET